MSKSDNQTVAPASDLVEVTVAPGHTISVSVTDRAERPGGGDPLVLSTLKSFGPGKTLSVAKSEVSRLLKRGAIVDPEAGPAPAPSYVEVRTEGQAQMVTRTA